MIGGRYHARFFQLNTAADLRAKLERDLDQLKSNPMSSDVAFNFFITAEHLLDWVYPKSVNKPTRTKERRNSVLLQVCSHLANGAKHFEVEDLHHDSVSSTDTAGGYFNASYFASPYFSSAYFGAGRRLVIRLKGQAAKQLGDSIEVVKLAENVMQYWNTHAHI
jgi:hypothetical protein